MSSIFFFKSNFIFFTFNFSGVHPIDLENVLSHVVIGLTVFIDMVVSGHQIDFVEDYLGLFSVAVGFPVFSFAHFIAGGTDCDGNGYIYPVMDWKNRESTLIFCVAQVLFASFVYFATYLLCRLRMCIHHSTMCADRSGEKSENELTMKLEKIEVC